MYVCVLAVLYVFAPWCYLYSVQRLVLVNSMNSPCHEVPSETLNLWLDCELALVGLRIVSGWIVNCLSRNSL